jgi:hypothetical protein
LCGNNIKRENEMLNLTANSSPSGKFFKTIPVSAVPSFVCYFDILGFSAATLHSTLQQSIDDFAIVRSILLQSAVLTFQDHGYLKDKESMAKYASNPFDPTVDLPFRYIMASDSVFYWGMDSVEKLIITMKSVAFSLFMMAIRQSRLVRGAVTRGRPMINPLAGIYFGKPIVECSAYEKRMTAPGIIIPLQYLAVDERKTIIEHLPYFVPSIYSFRDGNKEPCLYVNWVYHYVRKRSVRDLEGLRKQMEVDGFHMEKTRQLIDFLRDNLEAFPFPIV